MKYCFDVEVILL